MLTLSTSYDGMRQKQDFDIYFIPHLIWETRQQFKIRAFVQSNYPLMLHSKLVSFNGT